MSSKIMCRKVLGVLRPVNSYAEEQLAKYPNNAFLRVEIKQDRSGPHHNLFFAMLTVVADGCERETEELLDAIKMATGIVERYSLAGVIYQRPGSIAWRNMDQEKFGRFFDRACVVIEQEVGVHQPDLMRELEERFPDLFAQYQQWRAAA